MKKLICIILALAMIASCAMLLGGCKEKTKSSSDSGTSKATVAATAAPTAAPTNADPAPSPDAQETVAPQQDDTPDTDVTENSGDDDGQNDYYDSYGGLNGQEAILKALSYVGAGYQCVSYDRSYLRNQEAWYIGLQASDGSDPTVYYVYVNDGSCVPVSEIPNIGGENSGDSGIFNESFAGISKQEAIFKALSMMGDEYACVSSEEADLSGVEYWLIGVQEIDGSEEISYFYVNADSCFPA